MESALMPSAIDALVAVNGRAMSSFKSKSKRIHIFVVSLMQIGDEWKAVIRIVIEPQLELSEEAEDKKEKKVEDFNYRPMEKEKEIEIFDLISEEAYSSVGVQKIEPEVDFYMHPREAAIDDWEYVLPNLYPNYHYHFLENGSLWEISQKIFPDIDFDLAAEPQSKISPVLECEEGNSLLNRLRLKKNPYILELTEEF